MPPARYSAKSMARRSEPEAQLVERLQLKLVEIAEADSIALVAQLFLGTLRDLKCSAALLLRFPSHSVICRLDESPSPIRLTTLQQTLPILSPGLIPFSDAPLSIREALVSQKAENAGSEVQLFLLSPQDVDGVAVILAYQRREDGETLIQLLHRAVQARIASLYALDVAQQQTYTDDLTGLANRRYFVRRLAEEVDRAERHGRQLALIILDLDHLKQLNDSLGHQTGDEALREIAVRLRQSVRRIDTVCRYAGDEFCVIMPDAGSETCQALLRRLHLALNLSKSTIDCPTGTISMGAAIFPQHAKDPEHLLRTADNALRSAKKVRGTFVLADSTAESI